jgi:hypothetical protein
MKLFGSAWDYWYEICRAAGGGPLPDDSEWDLVRRFVTTGMVTPKYDDTIRDMVAKYLYGVADGNHTPTPGEAYNPLLRKLYFTLVGSEPPFADMDNELLQGMANFSFDTGFLLSTIDDAAWSLEDNGGGVAQITIVSQNNVAGADGYRAKYTDTEHPALNGQDTSNTNANSFIAKTLQFVSGDTIHVQIAWFTLGVQLSDWSLVKDLTLA